MNIKPAPVFDPPRWLAAKTDPVLQRLQPKGMPLLYEDEGLEMGESTIHTLSCGILFYGLGHHFTGRKNLRVFANLNLHYDADDPTRYVSPDVMVVRSARRFSDVMASYHIGRQGPAPCFVGEVLSHRTWQEGDLSNKPVLYADLGVREYALVDVTGTMLPRRLVLLRRQSDGKWKDEQDADGGLTSRLGFRLIVDQDGHLRVMDGTSGVGYPRPEEAAAQLQSLKDAFAKEVELRQRLEAELDKLRRLARRKNGGNPHERP